jgi:hypothetical protein
MTFAEPTESEQVRGRTQLVGDLSKVIVFFNVLVHLPVRNHAHECSNMPCALMSNQDCWEDIGAFSRHHVHTHTRALTPTLTRNERTFKTHLPRAFHPSRENCHVSSLNFNRRATLRGDCYSALKNQTCFLGRIGPVSYEESAGSGTTNGDSGFVAINSPGKSRWLAVPSRPGFCFCFECIIRSTVYLRFTI